MSDKVSFTKQEHAVLPTFRQRISQAESTEDVRKFFAYTAKDLLAMVSDGKVSCEYGDVGIDPQDAPYFTVSEGLRGHGELSKLWDSSDLPHVLGRLAETAVHRYRHLEKHPEKTNSKIR